MSGSGPSRFIPLFFALIWATVTLWAISPSQQLTLDMEALMEEDYEGPDKLSLTEEEWEERLTPEQFDILRKKGTERAFTGELLDNKEEGLYLCAGCGLPVFSSDAKYDSRTGWPSFTQPIHMKNVELEMDYSWFMVRTEVICARCEGHLGHVFDDGPPPTGKRWCINSVALTFKSSNGGR